MYRFLPRARVLAGLDGCPAFALFETRRFDRENFRSYIFTGPLARLETDDWQDLPALFAAAEAQLARGRWLAGFISYEAGYAFEDCLAPLRGRRVDGCPLAFFDVFSAPVVFDHRRGVFTPNRGDLPAPPAGRPARRTAWRISGLGLSVPRAAYLARVGHIRRLIAAGETYQVNYTLKYRFRFSGSPAGLYAALGDRQSVSYGALIRGGDFSVISLSPELFFRRAADRVVVRPMKGTIARGPAPAEDRRLARQLRVSAKDRAENLMIVDLLRNDLGRIARPGTVKVASLFDLERYQTLFQMTSTVTARLEGAPGLETIFRALFPCGSVTGAPKVRAMEIIRRLEGEPRGVYTGAVGFLAPGGRAVFNVAIRTVFLRGGYGEMGVGGGIVTDSVPAREYAESRLKGAFLAGRPARFRLLETMRFEAGAGYCFLEEHLARLAASARRFGFACPIRPIEHRLARFAATLDPAGAWLVRLRLARDGGVSLGARRLEPPAVPARAALSPGPPVDPRDPFIYHKTTRRAFYTRRLGRARAAGLYDVILRNRRGELTEGTFNNLFVLLDGVLCTPPIACGLLPGVLRARLLAERRAVERVLTPACLLRAGAVYLGNSARGLVKVRVGVVK